MLRPFQALEELVMPYCMYEGGEDNEDDEMDEDDEDDEDEEMDEDDEDEDEDDTLMNAFSPLPNSLHKITFTVASLRCWDEAETMLIHLFKLRGNGALPKLKEFLFMRWYDPLETKILPDQLEQMVDRHRMAFQPFGMSLQREDPHF